MWHHCRWTFAVPRRCGLTRERLRGWGSLAWVGWIVARTWCGTSFGGPTGQTTTGESKRTRTPGVHVDVGQERSQREAQGSGYSLEPIHYVIRRSPSSISKTSVKLFQLFHFSRLILAFPSRLFFFSTSIGNEENMSNSYFAWWKVKVTEEDAVERLANAQASTSSTTR